MIISRNLLKSGCIAAIIVMAADKTCAMPLSGYNLVWQDDFRKSAIDPGKWKPDTYTRDEAKLTADAITTGPDGLHIRTYTVNGVNYTGFITTRNLFMTTYGYFESRIRFHGASGEHCAFWSEPMQNGAIIGDPGRSGAEIDIIEHRIHDRGNNEIGNMAAFNLHWDGYGENHKRIGDKWIAPESLNNSWHTYAVLWTPNAYTFYVDDVEHWRSITAVSHAPQDLRLTCEVVGKKTYWSGTPPSEGFGPHTASGYGMDVDWVRVWQKAKQ